MAKKLQDKHSKFFRSLSLLMTLFVIGFILTLTYYVINATTSTSTQAAGNKCIKYSGNRTKCINYGCYYGKNGLCSSKNQVGNTNSGGYTGVDTQSKGNSPVKTKAGYCMEGLDCNVGWLIDGKFTPPQQPKGSYLCPQPYYGNPKVFCCPPGTHRDDVTKGPGNPGTCINN